MALFSTGSRAISHWLSAYGQVAKKRGLPREAKSCHNGQPRHFCATAVSLAIHQRHNRRLRHPAYRKRQPRHPVCHNPSASPSSTPQQSGLPPDMPQRPGWPDGAPRRSGLSPARRKRQPPFPGRLPFRDGGAGWERQRRSAFLAMGFPEFVLRTAGQACPQWDEGNARGGSTAAAALLGEFVRESLLHRDDRHGVRLLFFRLLRCMSTLLSRRCPQCSIVRCRLQSPLVGRAPLAESRRRRRFHPRHREQVLSQARREGGRSNAASTPSRAGPLASGAPRSLPEQRFPSQEIRTPPNGIMGPA